MAFVSFLGVASDLYNYLWSQDPRPPNLTPINSASTMAVVQGLQWPPPPTLSLRGMLLDTVLGPEASTPEVDPPDENCTQPSAACPSVKAVFKYLVHNALHPEYLQSRSASGMAKSEGLQWPPPPAISLRSFLSGLPAPETIFDPSKIWYSGDLGAATVYYVAAEGRLVGWLRKAAQLRDPFEILKQSAVSFYLVGAGLPRKDPPDTAEGAQALADLAVTGRVSYGWFWRNSPQDADLLDDVRNRVSAFQNPPDENLLLASVRTALDRAYDVSWAIRDPNPITRAQTRAALGWIAVSGEDDPPHRPVNVASASFPQFDIWVNCPAPLSPSPSKTITVETRYMIALPQPSYPSDLPTPPIRQVPGVPVASLPADHDVILFIHGMDSSVEECNDLAPQLHQTGLHRGKKYAIIAFDLPSSGYSQKIEHTDVAPYSATQYDSNPGSSPATYPLLDFHVEFVISFVNALDQQVPIKNRITAIIGGSLGGNLCLRLGERNDQPWIKNIVAWSPASVWLTFNHNNDFFKSLTLGALYSRMAENEDKTPDGTPAYPPSRVRFFYQAFDSPTGSSGPTQAQQWYRDGWHCKNAYIWCDRLQRREIYDEPFRRWHWRVALEQLLFSHWPNAFLSNRTRTLLIAGQADDLDSPPITDTPKIYSHTKGLARAMMLNTPGDSLFLLNTGHSIHNERPLLLSQQIVEFLAST
jgi:pimeloyl-ACP methyl ester carboxylesterase